MKNEPMIALSQPGNGDTSKARTSILRKITTWVLILAFLAFVGWSNKSKDAERLSDANAHIEDLLKDIDGMSKEEIKEELKQLDEETSPPPDDGERPDEY